MLILDCRLSRIRKEKKEKERQQKDMESANRRHLSSMRVVQKNLVYIIGLHPKLATEDVITIKLLLEYKLTCLFLLFRLFDLMTFLVSLEKSLKLSLIKDQLFLHHKCLHNQVLLCTLLITERKTLQKQ